MKGQPLDLIPQTSSRTLAAKVKELARDCGFAFTGVTSADDFVETERVIAERIGQG